MRPGCNILNLLMHQHLFLILLPQLFLSWTNLSAVVKVRSWPLYSFIATSKDFFWIFIAHDCSLWLTSHNSNLKFWKHYLKTQARAPDNSATLHHVRKVIHRYPGCIRIRNKCTVMKQPTIKLYFLFLLFFDYVWYKSKNCFMHLLVNCEWSQDWQPCMSIYPGNPFCSHKICSSS